MIYHVDSRVDLWRMREIFFANESWRSRGEARFKGDLPPVQGRPPAEGRLHERPRAREPFAFPDLRGSLVWEPHRFEVTNATARFYGGTREVPVPDGAALRPAARGGAVGRDLPGRRPRRSSRTPSRCAASGCSAWRAAQNLLEWPLGDVLGAPRPRPGDRRAAGRGGAARARAGARGGGHPRRAARVRPRARREPLPQTDGHRRRVHLPVRSRVARRRPEPPGDRAHLRRVPGAHGLRRPIASSRSTRGAPTGRRATACWPASSRPSGRRPASSSVGRPRRVPRDDDEVVQEPAHPGGVRRATACARGTSCGGVRPGACRSRTATWT